MKTRKKLADTWEPATADSRPGASQVPTPCGRVGETESSRKTPHPRQQPRRGELGLRGCGDGDGTVRGTYVVGGLLILVALLVDGSLGLVGDSLLLVQGLPPLSENLADLAWRSELVVIITKLS